MSLARGANGPVKMIRALFSLCLTNRLTHLSDWLAGWLAGPGQIGLGSRPQQVKTNKQTNKQTSARTNHVSYLLSANKTLNH